MKAKDNRFRETYRFLLDLTKPENFDLAEQIAKLKAARKFTPMLRDGLRLVLALREGEDALLRDEQPSRASVRMLETLFPRLVKHIADRHHAAQLETLHRELAELRARVDVAGVRLPEIERRPVLDDAPALEIKQAATSNPGKNFLKAMKGLKP